MLRALSLCLLCLLACAPADAEPWPQRPVRIVVPYAAGGGTDSVARVVAQKLGEILGQQFVIENRPGASGMTGAAAVARSEPNGYVLLVGSPAEVALNPNLFKDMTYDPLADLAPVTLLAWTPLVLAANPGLKASTVPELIDLARKQQLFFSSPGIGSSHHLTGEYINVLQHTRLVHVPYRGAAPAITDTISGQVMLTIAGMPPVTAFLASGDLKAIAVTSKTRSPQYPDIPAMAETSGFEDFDFTNWFGLLARAGTSQEIIDKLQKAAVEALKDPQVQKLLSAQAAVPVGNTPAEFHDFIRAEAARYKKIVEVTHLQMQ
jgi:tripartite-type tricarboxylate transporter receptor subunit TctC